MAERYFAFEFSGRLLAVEMIHSRELMTYPAVASVPQSPDWLLGVTHIRGELIPVFSLHPFVGVSPPTPRDMTRLLVLNEGDWSLGVPVTQAFAVDAETSQWVAHPDTAQCAALTKQLVTESGSMSLLSLPALRQGIESVLQFQLPTAQQAA
jgi:purine-binding chemotaxis protein CheW